MSQNGCCRHVGTCYEPSAHASEAGYKQPNLKTRVEACKPAKVQDRASAAKLPDHSLFPAPLVLPGDDLALDPECPPQSFQDWLEEDDRNDITPERRTVYVLGPPGLAEDASFMKDWTSPRIKQGRERLSEPSAQDVVAYLAAFYHGLPVKLLELSDFRFVEWEEQRSKTAPRLVGLALSDECTGIRTRACPDRLYPRQLNLDDLLDMAIGLLPKDAYALCLLVNHDLYEDEDDTFVCGRAYGGSRVAVISSARYCPTLDDIQSVETKHAWPASHCSDFVQGLSGKGSRVKKQKTTKNLGNKPTAPLGGTILTVTRSPNDSPSLLWLARMCRTASHELGHCFGIDHCTYYACIMQGSASLSEDARQPPYLCPVDLAKLFYATGSTVKDQYMALVSYCSEDQRQDGYFFAAFSTWMALALDTVSS